MAACVSFAPSVPIKFSDEEVCDLWMTAIWTLHRLIVILLFYEQYVKEEEDLYAKFKALQRQEEFLDLQVLQSINFVYHS